MATKPKPLLKWRVVDSETGGSLGTHAMEIAVSVDRPKKRATVELDSLEATLQKFRVGTVSRRSLQPEQGTIARRFLIPSLEDAAKLFCQAHLDANKDVLDRKCRGVARKEDKGLVTHATRARWPLEIRAKYSRVESDLCIVQATISARGSKQSSGWCFVGATMEEAQALCLRSVSTSVWKCLRFDSTLHAIYAWTSGPRVSPLDARAEHSVLALPAQCSARPDQGPGQKSVAVIPRERAAPGLEGRRTNNLPRTCVW